MLHRGSKPEQRLQGTEREVRAHQTSKRFTGSPVVKSWAREGTRHRCPDYAWCGGCHWSSLARAEILRGQRVDGEPSASCQQLGRKVHGFSFWGVCRY